MIKAGGKVTVTVKILEHVLESLIRSQVDINNMQFGFMPGHSTTDAIYILQQMQEKQFIRKKIYFAFVDCLWPGTSLWLLVGYELGNWWMDC